MQAALRTAAAQETVYCFAGNRQKVLIMILPLTALALSRTVHVLSKYSSFSLSFLIIW